MTVRSFIAFVTILFCAIGENSYACQCLPPDLPVKEFDKSAAVFVGTVTSISEPNDRFTSITVSLDVLESWKGIERSTVKISTAPDGAMCGLGGVFKKGKSYLIYASDGGQNGAEYNAGLCSRTKAIENANEDLTAFARFPKIFESPAKSAG